LGSPSHWKFLRIAGSSPLSAKRPPKIAEAQREDDLPY
jgi:hypothetical protein